MRLTHLLIVGALAISSVHAQYQVFIGDRDQQLGVRLYDPSTNSLSVFGACAQSGAYRFYYGLEIDRRTGHLWACDVAGRQIVRLDRNGNCVATYAVPAELGLPTGLSIHPSGLYLHVTFQNSIIATFDMNLGQFIANQSIPNASGLYGLQWSPSGRFLYVCDFGGNQVFQLEPTSYPPTQFNVVSRLATPGLNARNPYDVAVRHFSFQFGSNYVVADALWVTLAQGFYGPESYIVSSLVGYPNGTLSSWGSTLAHPENGSSVSFFGITYEASDNSLWVSDYIRGDIYQIDSNGNITQRASAPPSYKLGLGIDTYFKCDAGASTCPEDVNDDGIVDDADLLAILFAFGTSCE